ncbi:Nuclear RNA export factor 2 [Clarias magur]|uniref:Nuclear RNA export factor 2 n=1 Tax=Clarias magur TaxID=1594786 RepID=A0A8J4XBJ4_CLAMG|nr:Nuclear RNA export factor 2 [Clarias magur]
MQGQAWLLTPTSDRYPGRIRTCSFHEITNRAAVTVAEAIARRDGRDCSETLDDCGLVYSSDALQDRDV